MVRSWTCAASLLLILQPSAAIVAVHRASTCGAANDDDAITAASALLIKVMQENPAPKPIFTRHAVLIVPTSPTETGFTAASAYASLPKYLNEKGESVSEFTKFVTVGVSPTPSVQSPSGVMFGDDVCGSKGFADDEAMLFFKNAVPAKLRDRAPRFLDCALNECVDMNTETIDAQFPFLQALSRKQLRSNLLPILIQNQTDELGVFLGDALAMLTSSNGPWEGERVLFVFSSDFSSGLEHGQAVHCDEATSQLLATGDPAQVSKVFTRLLTGGKADGCNSIKALPSAHGALLAAVEVAKVLKLSSNRATVSNTHLVKKAADAAAARAAAEAAAGKSLVATNQTVKSEASSDVVLSEAVDAPAAAPVAAVAASPVATAAAADDAADDAGDDVAAAPVAAIAAAPAAVETEVTRKPPKPNTGYVSMLFWEDDRYIGKRLSSEAAEGLSFVQVAKHGAGFLGSK